MKVIRDALVRGFRENPVLIMMIGLCPVLACSTSANDALGMGIAATFVLLCSNVLVSALRSLIPQEIRIPVFIVIIATFTTVVDYAMQAYAPALSESLGVFVPLIVVNCIILARAESFAYRNGIFASAADALGMGAGFTAAIVTVGLLREALGNGTVFGAALPVETPAVAMVLPPGAFLALGVVVTLVKYIEGKSGRRATVISNLPSACDACGMRAVCVPRAPGGGNAPVAAGAQSAGAGERS